MKTKHHAKIVPSIEREKLREQVEKEKKQEFSDFMSFLNDLRRRDRISAEQLRDYRKQWAEKPSDREIIVKQLESL